MRDPRDEAPPVLIPAMGEAASIQVAVGYTTTGSVAIVLRVGLAAYALEPEVAETLAAELVDCAARARAAGRES